MSDLNFCPECNNILYARADSRRQQLKFLCRQCDFSRWADPNSAQDNCINRSFYNLEAKENIFVSPLVIKDPTLGRTSQWHCPKCGWQKAVFFQLPERVSDEAMMLVFVCCNAGCGYWTKQAYDEPVAKPSDVAKREALKTKRATRRDHSALFGDEDDDEEDLEDDDMEGEENADDGVDRSRSGNVDLDLDLDPDPSDDDDDDDDDESDLAASDDYGELED